MKTTKKIRGERGVALLLTIFGLLLLTAVAMAMLFSSDSETLIAVNYRDKEAAQYAAMSGVQEARDRLQPLTGDLSGFITPTAGPGPTQLPGAAVGQVLYIINPQNGETIAPWAPTVNGLPNPYYDKELCQEPYMTTKFGLTAGTVGVACSSAQLPSGNNWYAVYDDSHNATNWKLTSPLSYKWVRVTLKSDNMAPTWVQTPTSAANGSQVCWDTVYDQQIQIPAGAGANCLGASQGASIACATAGATPPCSLTLTAPGSGYSHGSPPPVTFSGGGGSGAAATAQLHTTPGGISSASLSSVGSGYTSPPTVTLVSPDGTGATLQALINGSPITGLTLGSSNYCYPTGTNNLQVNFTPSPPGTGNAATATVAMTTQACVSQIQASASCKSQKNKSLPLTSVPGGSGGGLSATVTFDNKGGVSAVTIANVGSYSALPASAQNITVSGCTITASFIGGIQINTLNLTNGGSYITQPSANISGSNPTAPSALQPPVTAAWTAGASNGTLSAIQVTAPGTGYALPSYSLSFSGGGGSGAVGTASASTTVVVSGITLTNAGSGYTSPPTVIIGGPGSGASATAGLTASQKRLLGDVYMLTALAVTPSGSQAMVQMEAAVPPPTKVPPLQLGGALTLAGTDPNFSTPHSNNFIINGNDANSCGETQVPALPAIGVADNNAQQCVISGVASGPGQSCTGLGKQNNYIGAQSAPDVQVTSAANPTPQLIQQLVTDLSSAPNAVNITGPATGSNIPSTTIRSITVVNGDLSVSGAYTGNGILVVAGNLTLSGNFSWNGLIFVLGTVSVPPNSTNNGGGNGQIIGAMYVASQSTSPISFTWNGGGGNGIQYDHCLADDLLNNIPPAPSKDPLQVLSTRTLQF